MESESLVSQLIAELKRREMHAFRASVSTYAQEGEYVALSLWASEAQRFLNLLVPGPPDLDDDLARHIVGHAADLSIEDDPWMYEATVGLESDVLVEMGAGVFRLRVTISVPASDLLLVLHRLGAL